MSPGEPGTFDVTKIGPVLEDIHQRLSGVVIECLAFGDFIKRYDRAETFFYLDPPYYGCESDYGKGAFTRSDFRKLADQLDGIAGRFLLSLNDLPEVRRIFDAFNIQAVDTVYSISKGNPKAVGEVIISNFDAADFRADPVMI